MAVNRGIDNFAELRIAAEGMREAADAILGFLDDQGIAVGKRSYKRTAATNGDGNGHVKNVDALREKVKAHFVAKSKKGRKPGGRKKGGPPKDAPDADGKHVTLKEAAKMLKMSDANVRLMTYDGRLPKPTYEQRPWSKDQPDRRKTVLVLLQDDVKKYAAALKEASA